MIRLKSLWGIIKLVGILVTHSHFDHVGALRDFLKSNRKLMVYKKSNLSDLEEKEIDHLSLNVIILLDIVMIL